MHAQNGTLLIAHQINALLQRLPIAVYTCPVGLFHGSTIGQHFRHILEFYTCLLEGCPAAHIDYSSRRRNDAISENPQTALMVLSSICADVLRLDAQQTVQVVSEFSDKPTDSPAYISSVGRELQYAFDHAVHHLAIIRMGLETCFPEIPVDEDLGVAPSTLRHREENMLVTL